MKNSILTAVFFLIFLTGSALIALPLMPNIGNISPRDHFEKSFVEALAPYTPIRNLWGIGEWTLFHQGRVGATASKDGNFYSDEELICHRDDLANFDDNMRQIETLEKDKNVLIVIIPSKARIYGALPACKEQNYAFLKQRFDDAGWAWVDGNEVFKKQDNKNALFLKTDTHWTPHGASIMADAVAEKLKKRNRIPRIKYKNMLDGYQMHVGDLGRYFPGLEPIFSEKVEKWKTTMTDHQPIGLLEDYYPDIALVGTSYSFMHDWNFEGFLKKNLRADIFNASAEGKRPIRIMQDFLASESYKKHPPKIIVWEIPERFLFMNDDLPS